MNSLNELEKAVGIEYLVTLSEEDIYSPLDHIETEMNQPTVNDIVSLDNQLNRDS